MIINSLTNIINEPTRQNALLDPVIIPEEFSYFDSGIIKVPEHIRDHSATFIMNLKSHINTQSGYIKVLT